MTVFRATAKNGGFDPGSDYNRMRLKQFLKENEGMRLKIEPLTPESDKQRRFFEGAVVPLVTFYQEGMDHHDADDRLKVRDWLKIEFNSDYVSIGGKAHLVPQSTKGKLNDGFLERVMDWMIDQGYQIECLDVNLYKRWVDEIYPEGGPDNFIDYLLETKRLKVVW